MLYCTMLYTLYKNRDELFSKYPLERFKANFRTLAKSVQQERDAVQFDAMALVVHQSLQPRGATTNRGELFWDGHAAQMLLRRDIAGNNLEGMTPYQARNQRPEYQQFSLSVFRGHFYQEKRRQKEEVAWQFRRNKKGYKKHEKEAEDLAS
jgi:hypothetical protein